MRNSSLLKWASGNNKNNNKAKANENGGTNKNWLHSPETLKNGHVVYLVKFLGSTQVDKPKGIDVVKQGIQKLKFNQQLKKSEGAAKTPKVELTISVEGVAIQEPKSKKVLHQYPLHKISYCADDKAEKRFFSFISKEVDGDKHICFVFVSDKLAEEITLTIGQAFELAYKKFLDTSGKDLETKKTLLTLQKRVALLENENNVLKSRLKDVSLFDEVKDYMKSNNLTDVCHVENKNQGETDQSQGDKVSSKESDSNNELICLDVAAENGGGGGEIDGFTLDDLNDEHFNPRAGSSSSSEDDVEFDPRCKMPKDVSRTAALILSPPPPALPPRNASKTNAVAEAAEKTATFNNNKNDNVKFITDASFGNSTSVSEANSNPFSPLARVSQGTAADPFGMSTFNISLSGNKLVDSAWSPNPQVGKAAILTPSGFGDAWAKVPTMPKINMLSLDELDPLKK